MARRTEKPHDRERYIKELERENRALRREVERQTAIASKLMATLSRFARGVDTLNDAIQPDENGVLKLSREHLSKFRLWTLAQVGEWENFFDRDRKKGAV